MKFLPYKINLAIAAVSCLSLIGCASDPNLVPDIVAALNGGVATVADIYTIGSAIQQNNTGKPITVASVVSDAQAGATALNSSNLTSAAQTFGTEIGTLTTDLKSAGATPAAIKTAVSSTVVAAQNIAAALPAGSSTTFYFNGKRDKQHGLMIVNNAPVHLWRPRQGNEA